MARKAAKVGIILMAYNQGPFIERAIESLKKQTFQDFDIHLVDDGSNDECTPEILERIQYDKIVKKFLHKDNKGTAPRQREQYKILQNEYILILCADDVLAPMFLEKTVGFLEKHKDYGVVSTNIKLFENDTSKPFGENHYDAKLMKLPYILSRNRVLGSSLMRKKALAEADLSGGFVRYQDWDRWISILEAGWKIGLVPEPLFYYRQVPTSLSHTASVEDELDIRKKLLKKHASSYKKYYKDIIFDMERAFLEIAEGKEWLDQQYRNMQKEIKRLNNEVQLYKNESAWQQLKRNFKNRHQEKK